jgi:Zn-dependent protease
MDFLNSGIPLGRYFGIPVRLHFTFLIFAYYRATTLGDLRWGLAYVAGLYTCILLHEFGHALAARWCDGDVDHILLWPLGGLAVCQCAWHPTAHLITAVAGPLVTLLLWLFFWGVTALMQTGPDQLGAVGLHTYFFLESMKELNFWLLLFNMIPAFPMDGGRVLRDTLWHWLSAETATAVAVWVSRAIAVAGMGYAVFTGQYMLIAVAAFILFQAQHEQAVVAGELRQAQYGFSLRERLKRRSRRREFYGAIKEQTQQAAVAGFHRCATCGRTEHNDPHLDFRICTECANGEEYCADHLDNHPHTKLQNPPQ